MFDLRMIHMSSECEYDWYWKISACSTEYEVCDSFASLTRQQILYSGSACWYFRYQSIHIQITYTYRPKNIYRPRSIYIYRSINIDYYMSFFISYPLSAREPIGSRDDIWMRAGKGYDMKNDMLWYVYHILQQRN